MTIKIMFSVLLIFVGIILVTSHTSFKRFNLPARVKSTALHAIKPTATTRQTAQLHLLGAVPPPEIEISHAREEKQDASNSPTAASERFAIEKPKRNAKRKEAATDTLLPSPAKKAAVKVKSKPKLDVSPQAIGEPSTAAVTTVKGVRAVKLNPKSTVKAVPNIPSKAAVKAVLQTEEIKRIGTSTVVKSVRKAPVKGTVKKIAVSPKSAPVMLRIVVAINSAGRISSTIVKAMTPRGVKIKPAVTPKTVKIKTTTVKAVTVKTISSKTSKTPTKKTPTSKTPSKKETTAKSVTAKTTATKETTVKTLPPKTVTPKTITVKMTKPEEEAVKKSWATEKVHLSLNLIFYEFFILLF